VAALLSYIVPGLGQIVQGRYGKGLLFMVSLLGMFFLGQAMGQWQNVYVPQDLVKDGRRQNGSSRNLFASIVLRCHYLGQFWIGAAAWPALWQYFDMPMPAAEKNPFLHNFQRMPKEEDVNQFLINSDKTPDLGWVYTVIAGMLNILVIYDAYAGAAFAPQHRPGGRELSAAAAARQEGGA
jgi:hypothetical protein